MMPAQARARQHLLLLVLNQLLPLRLLGLHPLAFPLVSPGPGLRQACAEALAAGPSLPA